MPSDDQPRPWDGPRCPCCNRRVYAVPGPDGRGLLSLGFTPAGRLAIGDHRCPPRGARYRAPAIVEGPPRGMLEWIIGD